jgi:hypothetical protein
MNDIFATNLFVGEHIVLPRGFPSVHVNMAGEHCSPLRKPKNPKTHIAGCGVCDEKPVCTMFLTNALVKVEGKMI